MGLLKPPTSTGAGCLARQATAQSIANGTGVLLTFDAEVFDDAGFHSTSTNPERLTIPAGLGGLYVVTASVRYAQNNTGVRLIGIRLNGSLTRADVTVQASQGAGTGLSTSVPLRLVAGDFVTAVAFQSSGGALDTEPLAPDPFVSLGCARIGA